MAETENPENRRALSRPEPDRRCRGRPQVRPDPRTRNQEALFEGRVSDRIDRFLSEVDLRAVDGVAIEEALYLALMACAELALDPEVVALQRIILQEAGKFSGLAGMFYTNGIQRTIATLAGWLRTQEARGLIMLDDCDEAAGMLLGLVASAPRRCAPLRREPLFKHEAVPQDSKTPSPTIRAFLRMRVESLRGTKSAASRV